MATKISNPAEIRLQNTGIILKEICSHPGITLSSISEKQRISFPTVASITSILKKEKIVLETGHHASSGGRKAAKLSINPELGRYCGISISKHNFRVALLKADGTVLYSNTIYKIYRDSKEYLDYLRELFAQLTADTVLPVYTAIALPGQLNTDRSCYVNQDGFEEDSFSISPLQDAFADLEFLEICQASRIGALAELNKNPDHIDCVYLLLNRDISGTVILDDLVFELSEQDCDFGGMLIAGSPDPNDTAKISSFVKCCSASSIIAKLIEIGYDNPYDLNNGPPYGDRYEYIFEQISAGNTYLASLWDNYLRNLALGLFNIRRMFGLDIVIGGEMAPHIAASSSRLEELLNSLSPSSGPFFHFSTSGYADDAVGAALHARNQHMVQMAKQIMNSEET